MHLYIWFLCFVIAAVRCCIHVCSVSGEISQRKWCRRVKTTELNSYIYFQRTLNSPGGFKVHPGFAILYPHRAQELKRHALRFTYNVLVFTVSMSHIGSIREYGSTLYVGMTRGKNGGRIKRVH